MRHGDDREAGRLRRARQHDDARPPGGDGRLRADRAQVVLQRADVRRVPRARPGRPRASRASLVPADPARRRRATRSASSASRTSSATAPTPVARGRARRHRGRGSSASRAAASRRSSRWSATRGWTACIGSAAGDARGRRAGDVARGAPQRVRQAAGRAAADAQRPRRPRASSPRPRPRWRCASRAPTTRTTTRVQAASATAVGKYWVCKRAPAHAAEALECLGGNGYVEESGMPRLYRESPLNSIWEGSGNVNALDVLRALARSRPRRSRPSSTRSRWPPAPTPRLDALRRASSQRGARRPRGARGARPARRRAAGARAAGLAARPPRPARGGRRVLRVAAGRRRGLAFGTLPAGIDLEAIVERHTPPLVTSSARRHVQPRPHPSASRGSSGSTSPRARAGSSSCSSSSAAWRASSSDGSTSSDRGLPHGGRRRRCCSSCR